MERSSASREKKKEKNEGSLADARTLEKQLISIMEISYKNKNNQKQSVHKYYLQDTWTLLWESMGMHDMA